jgi:hypothetical protein
LRRRRGGTANRSKKYTIEYSDDQTEPIDKQEKNFGVEEACPQPKSSQRINARACKGIKEKGC